MTRGQVNDGIVGCKLDIGQLNKEVIVTLMLSAIVMKNISSIALRVKVRLVP